MLRWLWCLALLSQPLVLYGQRQTDYRATYVFTGDLNPQSTNADWRIKFVTEGEARIRILSLSGDAVIWTDGAADGGQAGVSVAFKVPDPRAPAENAGEPIDVSSSGETFYAAQGIATRQAPCRIPLDARPYVLLWRGSVLAVKAANWLNTTGGSVKVRVVVTVRYRTEADASNSR